MGQEFALIKIVEIALVKITMIVCKLKLVFISYQRKILFIYIHISFQSSHSLKNAAIWFIYLHKFILFIFLSQQYRILILILQLSTDFLLNFFYKTLFFEGSLKMKTHLRQIGRQIITQFKLQSKIYYQSISLYNLLQLKKPCKHNKSKKSTKKVSYIKRTNNKLTTNQTITNLLQLITCIIIYHKFQYSDCLSNKIVQLLKLQHSIVHKLFYIEIQTMKTINWYLPNIYIVDQVFASCQKWDNFIAQINIDWIGIEFHYNQYIGLNNNNIQYNNDQKDTYLNLNYLCQILDYLCHSIKLPQYCIQKQQKQNQSMFYIIIKISISILYVVINHLAKPVFTSKYYLNQQASKQYVNNLSFDYVFNDFFFENYHFELKNINEQVLFVKEILSERLICSEIDHQLMSFMLNSNVKNIKFSTNQPNKSIIQNQTKNNSTSDRFDGSYKISKESNISTSKIKNKCYKQRQSKISEFSLL